jgi:hypothetical protein
MWQICHMLFTLRNNMKKILILVFGIFFLNSNSSAFQQVIPDEIRGGPLQTILSPKTCTDGVCNLKIVLFHREKVVQVVFQSEIRVPGIKLGSPGWITWPRIESNIYSIRFDPDIIKILNDKDLAMKTYRLYPSCSTDSCPNGTPRVMTNIKGHIISEKQPSGRNRQWLQLTESEGFETFFLLVQSSKKIVLEMNGYQYVIEQ